MESSLGRLVRKYRGDDRRRTKGRNSFEYVETPNSVFEEKQTDSKRDDFYGSQKLTPGGGSQSVGRRNRGPDAQGGGSPGLPASSILILDMVAIPRGTALPPADNPNLSCGDGSYDIRPASALSVSPRARLKAKKRPRSDDGLSFPLGTGLIAGDGTEKLKARKLTKLGSRSDTTPGVDISASPSRDVVEAMNDQVIDAGARACDPRETESPCATIPKLERLSTGPMQPQPSQKQSTPDSSVATRASAHAPSSILSLTPLRLRPLKVIVGPNPGCDLTDEQNARTTFGKSSEAKTLHSVDNTASTSSRPPRIPIPLTPLQPLPIIVLPNNDNTSSELSESKKGKKGKDVGGEWGPFPAPVDEDITVEDFNPEGELQIRGDADLCSPEDTIVMPTATFADEIRAMSADTVETPPCMFFSHVAGRVKEDAAEPSSCLGAVQNGPSSPPPIQPPCSSEFVTALECNGTMASPSPTGDSNIQFLSDEREQSSRNRIASSPAEPRPHPLISSTDPEGYTEADSPDNQQSSSLKLSSSLSIVSPSQQLTSSESPPQGLFFLHWLSAEKCGNGASAAAALIRDLRSQVVNCQAEINRLKTIVSLQMNSTSCDHGTSVPSLEGRNTTTGRNRLHPNVGQTVRQIASHKKYRAPRRSNSTLSASPIPVALSNKDVIAMISPHIDSHNSTTQPVPKGTASTLEFRSAMTHSSSMSSQSALEQSHATKINKSPESFSHLATASHSSISCAETDTPEQIFGRRAMVPGFLDALRWLEEEADKFSERFPAGNSCSHGREV